MSKVILFIITSLNMGGAEVQVFLLSKELRRRGYIVHLISMIYPKNFVDELESNGVVVHSLNMRPGIASLSALYDCLRIVTSISPDIVHSHMFHANVFARALRILSLFKFKLISTAHNVDETEGSLIRYWLYRSTRSLSSFNTNVSRIAFDKYVRLKLIDPDEGAYVPNGVSLESIDTDPFYVRTLFEDLKNKFIWLAAGRLVKAKDYPNLIDAVAVLRSYDNNFCVLIAGDGDEYNVLNDQIRSLNLTDSIKLLGVRQDLGLLMSSVDAYVMSSRWEGLPLVLLEALSHGKAIVATNVGGVSEIVGEHSGGELVPSANPKILADRMLRIMKESSDSLAARGVLAKKSVTKYSIESVTSKWVQIYSNYWD